MFPWDLCVTETVTGVAALCQHEDQSRGAWWAYEEIDITRSALVHVHLDRLEL